MYRVWSMNIYTLYYIIDVTVSIFLRSIPWEDFFPSFVFHEAVIKIITYKVKKKKKKNANDRQRINIHSRALVHEKWCAHFAISIAKYSQLPRRDGVEGLGDALSGRSRFILLFCDLDEEGKKASTCRTVKRSRSNEKKKSRGLAL